MSPASLVLLAAFAAQEQSSAPASRGSETIAWVLPGQFEEARRRAIDEQRLVAIKGISFGVDEAGAQCASKGRW